MLRWLYPVVCELCGVESERSLCPACLDTLTRVPRPICLYCGTPLQVIPPDAECCDACRGKARPFLLARSALQRTEQNMELLYRLKYHRHAYLASGGCTPTALAIGVGRSQFEATALMMEAMVYSDFNKQSRMEKYITDKVNETNVGPLGLNGKTTVLATFMKVGPQRASGVRVVAMRPGCCFEPRMACIEL